MRVGEAKSRLQHLIRMRYYEPHMARFLGEDPLASGTMMHVKKTKAARALSRNTYSYVLNNPANFVDPSGLERKCNSGNCPDCPHGFWACGEASVDAFFFGGLKWATATCKCIENGYTARFTLFCVLVGKGGSIGVGASGSLVGGAGCTCEEDLGGSFWGGEAGGGVGITGVGRGVGGAAGSRCIGGGGGAGIGFGAYVRGSYCEWETI
ncbi:MAG: RHS repeat-associated core domain-containing protein [Chloroflexota bacterium]